MTLLVVGGLNTVHQPVLLPAGREGDGPRSRARRSRPAGELLAASLEGVFVMLITLPVVVFGICGGSG